VPGNFRDLRAYQLSAQLAAELHRSVRAWPSLERRVIGEQLLRAAHGVGANIAEATGRWTVNDRRRFLYIARGSLHETEHWILAAEEQGLLKRGTSVKVDEIARLLNGLIRKQPPKDSVIRDH
jgi:four helix bundle protein